MPDARTQRTDTRRRHTLSVRVRLMIVALMAIVPVVMERIHNEELDRNDRIEAAQKRVLDVARQGAAEQNQAIASTRALLQVVADAQSQFKFSDDECTRFLTTVASTAPGVRTLSVANVLGTITCSSTPEALGLDISKRPHFTKAIDTAGFVMSDYFSGTRVHQPLVTLALAERGANGAVAAVVLGVLDLSWFERAAKTILPASGCVLMLDGNGTVLAQYPQRENVVGRSFKTHPLVATMLAHPEGLVTGTALDGVRRIFGYAQLPGTNARIAIGISEREVLTHANREMWIAFAELGVVAVLVMLGIWFGGERVLVRPVRTLAETASRIGHGDRKTHAAALPWAAEFVPLAVALDDMAGKLHAREQELRDSNAQLRELAQVDALTGLANRRAFNTQLAGEWQTALKQRQPIAILMIDVDYFKRFNDCYGHVQGDNCLRRIGAILLKHSRAEEPAPAGRGDPSPAEHSAGRRRAADFAARYGGEEFAMVLPNTTADDAERVAERLRQAVEDMLMAHAGAPWGFVSISLGIAAMTPNKSSNPSELVECADAALYEAKKRGRNRVAVHAAVPVPLSQAS
ncbi:MAG TPA: GGDEF domain-containing protein [Pseudolabrys sp.]|nr:GGDEF domain-containing protein [Pseudolabrys sp.]